MTKAHVSCKKNVSFIFVAVEVVGMVQSVHALRKGWGGEGLRGAGVVRADFPDPPLPPGVAPVTSHEKTSHAPPPPPPRKEGSHDGDLQTTPKPPKKWGLP